jgi:hypothetical protein
VLFPLAINALRLQPVPHVSVTHFILHLVYAFPALNPLTAARDVQVR